MDTLDIVYCYYMKDKQKKLFGRKGQNVVREL